jgi:hypothetical protein
MWRSGSGLPMQVDRSRNALSIRPLIRLRVARSARASTCGPPHQCGMKTSLTAREVVFVALSRPVAAAIGYLLYLYESWYQCPIGGQQPAAAEVADVQLDVGPLDPVERVETGLAPLEPAPKLVGVLAVRVSGVPGQIRDRRQLGAGHRVGLERQQDGVRHGCSPAINDRAPSHGSPHTR